MITRRGVLGGGGGVGRLRLGRGRGAEDLPPIVFVHGDSDLAATWQTVFWRFESNGYPREKLFAISFTNPQARDDNTVAQADRSSTDDELKELSAFVDARSPRPARQKVAFVANSRGCLTTRNYLAHGGADKAVACGAVRRRQSRRVCNCRRRSAANTTARGRSSAISTSGDETEGVKSLTLRSDGYDLYAQPDGAYIGHAGMKTNITSDGPALKGAENLMLDHVDHRETAFSPRAFAEIYKFIVGAAPSRIAIVKEDQVTLNGRVTGVVGDTVDQQAGRGRQGRDLRRRSRHRRPQGRGAAEQNHGRGRRLGAAADRQRRPRWSSSWPRPDQLVTHIYRSPFPRSFGLLDLRPALASEGKGEAAAIVTMNRPRGYFGLPRDVILIDGKTPDGIPPGVPAIWRLPVKFATLEDRPIVCEFNLERIVARQWPLKDKHIASRN